MARLLRSTASSVTLTRRSTGALLPEIVAPGSTGENTALIIPLP